MEELISESEIAKRGYKPETALSFIKGKSRYILCSSCNKWQETKEQPDRHTKILKIQCFWNPGHSIVVKLK